MAALSEPRDGSDPGAFDPLEEMEAPLSSLFQAVDGAGEPDLNEPEDLDSFEDTEEQDV